MDTEKPDYGLRIIVRTDQAFHGHPDPSDLQEIHSHALTKVTKLLLRSLLSRLSPGPLTNEPYSNFFFSKLLSK